MENKTDLDIQIKEKELTKKDLENQLLDKQVKYFNKYATITSLLQTIGLPLIIVGILALAGTRIANTIKEKELEITKLELDRRYQLDLTNFLMINQDAIFSLDTNKQSKIKKVMLVTFSKAKIDSIFPKINNAINNNSSTNIWLNGTPYLVQVNELMTSGLKNVSIKFYYNFKNLTSVKLLSELENIGFKVIKITSSHEDINTIWFTQDFDLKTIKLFAKFLVQNGLISIEKIYFSQYSSMKNTIVIGNHGYKTASTNIKFPLMTIEQIDSLHHIKTFDPKEVFVNK